MLDKIMKTDHRDGEKIIVQNGEAAAPDFPIIPRIVGDGIGRDISLAALKVFDSAVRLAYSGNRKICWLTLSAGEEAFKRTGSHLPDKTLEALLDYAVSIKGPLTTPVGTGIRSINVALRQTMDLYCCVRPVRWFEGVPSPVKNPEKLDVVIFRENTEDVYAGIEFKKGEQDTKRFMGFMKKEFGKIIAEDSGIGVKPMSEKASKRLVRKAIQFCIRENRKSVTIVHKGNIMKFTEGAFKDWGYEIAKSEFGNQIITEEDLSTNRDADECKNRVIIKNRIADAMFHDLLIYPEQFSVIASPNLNGDYLSDACAAQVGGLGIAPGANIGDNAAIFEATHGTAPKLADKNIANPGSLILSGVMMLEYIGWNEAAKAIINGFEKTIKMKKATSDIANQMKNGIVLGTSEFADEVIKNM